MTAGPAAAQPVVLHVSPHPDDEAIPAGMTLLGLAHRGWRVVNLLISLGRPGEEPRRLAEAEQAAHIGGYALDHDSDILTALARHRPRLVIGPQPHDGHPTHERVGRALRDAVEELPEPPVLWFWGFWADLALPNLYLPFGEAALTAALSVVDAYRGELVRNDYRRVVHGRAMANSVLGPERVFGFGSAAVSGEPFAEVLTEAIRVSGHWYAGRRRVVDLASPLCDPPAARELLDGWISDRRW